MCVWRSWVTMMSVGEARGGPTLHFCRNANPAIPAGGLAIARAVAASSCSPSLPAIGPYARMTWARPFCLQAQATAEHNSARPRPPSPGAISWLSTS